MVRLGKSQNLCELPSGPYTETKVITKSKNEVAVDADPLRTQLVHRNYLVEYFPPDNELPSLLSKYEKPLNDDKTEHLYNECASYRLSQLIQPIDLFAER